MDIAQAIRALDEFTNADPTSTIAQIETSLAGTTLKDCSQAIAECGASSQALGAAALMKQLAGQINVVIHALGILRCLPHILQPGEVVESLSLGAGNTGRDFDLETNQRVAEFKFIRWRGGPETIRQNSLFKDFFELAEHDTDKQRCLYVLGTQHPLAFLTSGRAISSVLNRNVDLHARFQSLYPECSTVQDYYAMKSDNVTIVDVADWLPELISAQLDDFE